MGTELTNGPTPHTIDVTGLPEQTVRQVLQIVREAREKQALVVPTASTIRPPLRGRFEYLGYSVPKEVIDEAQREAWANFPRDFPTPDES